MKLNAFGAALLAGVLFLFPSSAPAAMQKELCVIIGAGFAGTVAYMNTSVKCLVVESGTPSIGGMDALSRSAAWGTAG